MRVTEEVETTPGAQALHDVDIGGCLAITNSKVEDERSTALFFTITCLSAPKAPVFLFDSLP